MVLVISFVAQSKGLTHGLLVMSRLDYYYRNTKANGVINGDKLTGGGSGGIIKAVSSLNNRLSDGMPLVSIKFTRMPVNIFF